MKSHVLDTYYLKDIFFSIASKRPGLDPPASGNVSSKRNGNSY